jgi:hypothetical protein
MERSSHPFPHGAQVIRESDGADIGVTPFKESWPTGTGIEKLRIELDGFVPVPIVVPLDRGVDLSFALKKIQVQSNHPKKVREVAGGTTTPKGAPVPSVAPAQPTPKREPVPL